MKPSAVKICLAAVLTLLLLSAVDAQAGPVSLAWDANTETSVTGYVVSYGNAPGQTVGSADVGLQTTWTFTGGVAGRTYYFRVQAYTIGGHRSLPSSEVSTTIPNPPSVGPDPFGSVDTPTNGVTGVTGSLAMTGWALDNVLVTRIRIFREAIAGEAAGSLTYIGDASFVPGARPDVAALYPGLPANTRAGWGYLLLTNFLPNRGNGTFVLRAYADDADGHSTLLGARQITCTNDTATAPFGAIDTPTQGQTVSGTINVFGWVLARGTRRADPPGGGTVTVVIDGVPVGSPTGWTTRPDLAALFPAAEYSGIGTAMGVFTFNTNTLANGIHTIAWSVIDNQGAGAGIGSRYFTVANGAGMTLAPDASASSMAVNTAGMAVNTGGAAILGRRGFDFDAPLRTYRPDAQGITVVQAEELDRIELHTGAREGVWATPKGFQPLPSGAKLDPNGVFTWQPGLAFVGTYDFVFTGWNGSNRVRVVLNPKGTGRVGPQVVIDTPAPARTFGFGQPFVVAGWAADLDEYATTGIEAIHVWAYPVTGAAPMFVGTATLGGARPDVAAVYGDRFRNSGYGITIAGLTPGDYDLALFAWSSVKQGFIPAKTVRVTVR